MDLVVIKAVLLQVPDVFAFKDMPGDFFPMQGDMKEPKGVVFVPKEEGFCGEVVDCGAISEVPIQELFLGDFSNSC